MAERFTVESKGGRIDVKCHGDHCGMGVNVSDTDFGRTLAQQFQDTHTCLKPRSKVKRGGRR